MNAGPGRVGGSDLPRRVRTHLDRAGLLPPGTPLVVAVSGGIDSVVLLHLLAFPLRDCVGSLAAAHLDHGMRPDSRDDASWVAGLCRAWDLPLAHRRADPPPRGEASARRARYDFLEGVSPDGSLIATAHHADDQAETVLFRLIRGTGMRGLQGIRPHRGRIVRPLLPFPRVDLEAYARAVGLTAREDPTNREPRFARNRLRLAVLPELERIQPGATRAMAALAHQARQEERAWRATLERLREEVVLEADASGVTLARSALRSYHPALQARVLRDWLRRYGSTPGRAGTQAALEFISSGPSGGSLDLAGGVRLHRDFDRVRLEAPRPPPPMEAPLVIEGADPGRGRATVGGRELDVVWGEVPRGPGYRRVTLPAPAFPLRVRGWQAGDRIRLGYGSKKLKKLFTERRLDRRTRVRTPVVVDRDDRVLWVVGLARAVGVVEDGIGFQIAVRDAG
jgi:tRNA(Ile)-lysidine synthase